MNKKSVLVIVTWAIALLNANAQNTTIQWSEKLKYNKGQGGIMSDLIGSNSTYVYAIYKSPTRSMVPQKKTQCKIVAFDKTNLKLETSIDIFGYKTSKEDKQELKGKVMYEAVVNESNLYLFWVGMTNKNNELYVQTINKTLKSKSSLKLIYSSKTRGSESAPAIEIISNESIKNKFYVVAEQKSVKNENIKFDYVEFDANINKISKATASLPLTASDDNEVSVSDWYLGSMFEKKNRLSGKYELGLDGNIYINHIVKLSNDEELANNESNKIYYLNTVIVATNDVVQIPLKLENKNLFKIKQIFTPDGIALAGMYSDLSIDKKGEDLHGIFYYEFNAAKKTTTYASLVDFDKETLNKLYTNDTEDKKKKSVLKGKRANESNMESIKNDYVIEHIEENKNNEVLIFASRMKNTYKSSQKYTRTFCEKRNVTIFKIKKEGKLVWASNLDRIKNYEGEIDKYDIDVTKNNDGDGYKISYPNNSELSLKKKITNTISGSLGRFEFPVKETVELLDSDGSFKKDKKNKPLPIIMPEDEYKLKFEPTISTFGNESYIMVGSWKERAILRSKGTGYIGKITYDTITKKKGK